MNNRHNIFTEAMLAIILFCLFPTTVFPQTLLKGYTISGDPTSCNGATWTYKDTVDGIVYDLKGVLFKPFGTGPFPAVILSHGAGDQVAGLPTALSNTMVTWGLVCIGTNLTHSANVPLGAPGSGSERGASTANILRLHKCWDILASLGYVDTNYIAAHGFSFGAYASAALVGAYPTHFRVASHAGGGIGTGSATTESQVATIITPYQIHHGIPDTQIPLAWDVAFNTLLESNGVPTQFYAYGSYQHIDLFADNTMLRRIKEWYTQNGLFTLVPLHVGKVLRVPQEYSTIQTAIDSAESSDTVLVSEGRYYENIRYKRKGIVLTSRYFITQDWQTVANTIIDGSRPTNIDTAATVQLLNYEDSTNVLDGFTITGGTGIQWVGSFVGREGGGIILSSSTAIIKNNIIINNKTAGPGGSSSGGGGGISSMYGDPTISNNIIVSNTAGYAGGIVLNWSKGKIRNNIIYHNSCTGNWGGGGVMIWQAPKRGGYVENNTIIGNTSSMDGGGITISVTDASTNPIVKNNIIWGNVQTVGGQINLPQYADYNNVEDYSSGTNIAVHPQLEEGTFLLSPTSPCIDAGNPAITYNDVGDPSNPGMALPPSHGLVRNDIGAYGGPFASILTSLDMNDFRLSSTSISIGCYTDQSATSGVLLFNTGSKNLTIDSVTHRDTSRFSLDHNHIGQVIDFLKSDSIQMTFKSSLKGTFYDTISVFHQVPGKTNPMKIVVKGTSSNYSLSINSPNGTVTVNPPGGEYSIGTVVTVALTAAPGYRFVGWTDDVPVGHESDNPLTLTIDGNKTITANFVYVRQIALRTGWSLVSIPLLQTNYSADIIFPGKFGSLFLYNAMMQSYLAAPTLSNGTGYWIYYQNPDTCTISGALTGPQNIAAYQAGWLLIGSRHTPIAVSALQVSTGEIFGDAFNYDNISGSYHPTSMINPGEAAWIYVTKACTVTIP